MIRISLTNYQKNRKQKQSKELLLDQEAGKDQLKGNMNKLMAKLLSLDTPQVSKNRRRSIILSSKILRNIKR